MPPTPDGDVLRVEHISKKYGAVTALTDVNMRLGRGEVLGLIGDNGAGKSTLLKIICGFQPPTSGRIFLEGQEVVLKSVDHASSLGIDAVYQDLALVNQLTRVPEHVPQPRAGPLAAAAQPEPCARRPGSISTRWACGSRR